MATEITVGIAGAAGDGLDRTGDTLARTAARLGLHLYTYNSYQSLIRGGHTWLRLRLAEQKVDNHGDHLTVLVALRTRTASSGMPVKWSRGARSSSTAPASTATPRSSRRVSLSSPSRCRT